MKLANLPDSQLFAELAELHGHYCPMSTLGLRLGWAALRRLNGELQDASYLAQTCARDGIRLALKLETLKVEAQDRHLLRFSDSNNHWQIALLPQTLELAASYRLLATDNEREAVLERLRSADENDLLHVSDGGVTP